MILVEMSAQHVQIANISHHLQSHNGTIKDPLTIFEMLQLCFICSHAKNSSISVSWWQKYETYQSGGPEPGWTGWLQGEPSDACRGWSAASADGYNEAISQSVSNHAWAEYPDLWEKTKLMFWHPTSNWGKAFCFFIWSASAILVGNCHQCC